jgi:hypothetical protein
LSAASWPSTTGVSSTPIFFAAASAARRRQVSGATELAMQITAPGASASIRPACSTTASTWSSVATMTTTTSANLPISAGEPRCRMPSFSARRTASALMS